MAEKKDLLKGKKINEETLEQVSGGQGLGGPDIDDENWDYVSVLDREIEISTEIQPVSNPHSKIKKGSLYPKK